VTLTVDIVSALAVGIHPAWLLEVKTLEEAETQAVAENAPHRADRLTRGGHPPDGPFMFAQAEWERFKTKLQPGDELWSFCSPAATWQSLSGRAGYCILRGEVLIAAFVTRLN